MEATKNIAPEIKLIILDDNFLVNGIENLVFDVSIFIIILYKKIRDLLKISY
jgi:hypothetical protein